MSTDRPVLVTGANSGVGLATVIALAHAGFRAVGSVRSEAKAATVQAEAARAGAEIETVLLDVTDAERCAAVVGELAPLYGIVNNAGYGGVGAIEDVSDDEVRQRFETMTIAPLRLARLALPGMRASGSGRIVNVSSVYGRATTALAGWYQAAKHALEAASDALRIEVAADGVHVTLIEPGGIRTEIWADLEADVQRRSESRYTTAYERSRDLIRLWQRMMIDPDAAARTITRALEAKTPRPRYVVGLDAQAFTLLSRAAPTWISDRVNRFLLDL